MLYISNLYYAHNSYNGFETVKYSYFGDDTSISEVQFRDFYLRLRELHWGKYNWNLSRPIIQEIFDLLVESIGGVKPRRTKVPSDI